MPYCTIVNIYLSLPIPVSDVTSPLRGGLDVTINDIIDLPGLSWSHVFLLGRIA